MAKGPEAFRTISEAAVQIGVPQHVLRFWETRFSFVRPLKRAGGRRFYRPADIEVLATIRRLLHDEGYTIKGVQKLHRESGLRSVVTASIAKPHATEPAETSPRDSTATKPDRSGLLAALADLEVAKAKLDALLAER